MKIVLSPGHGNSDHGAIGYRNSIARKADPSCVFISPTEANLNLRFCHILAHELAAGHGHEVEMTRLADDENPSLEARCQQANHGNADLFLSIHHNSAPVSAETGLPDMQPHGLEVLYYPASVARTLAVAICAAVQVEFAGEWKSRGAVESRGGELQHTDCPAVVIKVGFVSNPSEEYVCGLPEFQMRMSGVIAQAVSGWLRGRE